MMKGGEGTGDRGLMCYGWLRIVSTADTALFTFAAFLLRFRSCSREIGFGLLALVYG